MTSDTGVEGCLVYGAFHLPQMSELGQQQVTTTHYNIVCM